MCLRQYLLITFDIYNNCTHMNLVDFSPQQHMMPASASLSFYAFRFGDTRSCLCFCVSTVSGKQCIARGRWYWFCHEFLSAESLVSRFLLKFPNLLRLAELIKSFMVINYVLLAIIVSFKRQENSKVSRQILALTNSVILNLTLYALIQKMVRVTDLKLRYNVNNLYEYC